MADYTTYYSTKATPQSQPIPGRTDMARNNAGGYGWEVDDRTRLMRFLVLGSEAPTYYVSQQELTVQNAETVRRLVSNADTAADAVMTAVSVSEAGRAPKNDPALFVMAMALAFGPPEAKRLVVDNIHRVARTGYHWLTLARYVEGLRGWGRAARRTFWQFFERNDASKLAYQVAKYRQRGGWSIRDLLRLTHWTTSDPVKRAIVDWVAHREDAWPPREAASADDPALASIAGLEAVSKAKTVDEVLDAIKRYRLTWEMVPTEWLNRAKVWEALLPNLPYTALMRNLGRLSALGLVAPMSERARWVADRLTDEEWIKKSRVHPLAVLSALAVYNRGGGVLGDLTWEPAHEVVDALDAAFYSSFGNVEPIGRRVLLALDVSGSMADEYVLGLQHIPARTASAAMAMVTARVESQWHIVGFMDKLVPLGWFSSRMRLNDVVSRMRGLPFGRTDCAQPMIYAQNRKMHVDAFIIYTDNETWYGRVHPVQALHSYRNAMGIDARLVTVAMTSTGFSIADPTDPGMLDVVGFDTAAPNLIGSFCRGEV